MKKKELIEIIRNAVRQEIKETLPVIMKECINSTPIRKKKLVQELDPVKLAKEVLASSSPKSSAKKKKVVRYAKNEALNEALNATMGGIPQEGARVGEGTPSTIPTHTDLNGNEVSVEELPDPLANALTRDYSELMSAIDKKKGGGS